MLLGIFIRINHSLLNEQEYFLKETVEPMVGIVIIYIIMALLNRNGLLDIPTINDFVEVLLIVGGFVTFISIII